MRINEETDELEEKYNGVAVGLKLKKLFVDVTTTTEVIEESILSK